MADAPTAKGLAQQAESEVGQQVATETAPYESDITQAQGGMEVGLAGIGKMFGNLMPYAKDAAKFVGDYYDASLAREKSIYEDAQGRLSLIRAQRAAEAQQMAQQTGGPVNVEAFLAPLNTSMVELPNAQANTLFHSNMLAQGGVQEAQAWAGRVFPMLQVEQETQLRNEFQAKIDSYQKEIDRIKASASGRVKTRLEELQEKERTYKLEQAKLALDRLKADRDWRTAQQQLKNQTATLANDRANILGYVEGRYKGKDGKIHTWRKPTLAAKELGAKTATEAAALAETESYHNKSIALDQQQIDNNKVNADRAYQHNQQVYRNEQLLTAGKLIMGAMTPGTQTYTHTRYDEVPPNVVSGMTSDAKSKLIPIKDAKGKVHYYKQSTETLQSSTAVITDPTELFHYLVSNGTPRDIALQAVQNRFMFSKKWQPGDKYDPSERVSLDKINKMDFNEARAKAIQEGWKPDPKKKATLYTLQTWLYNHYGHKITDKQHPPETVYNPKYGKKTGSSRHTYKGQQLPPGVEYDLKTRTWINRNTNKVWLGKGHPPDKNGNPT